MCYLIIDYSLFNLEYRQLSSGYYVHNIQAYLQNAHEILIAMGYTNIDDTTLQLATVPNPSFLKEVSRDCFLASQECSVIFNFYVNLK